MGCLIALIAMLSPRAAFGLVWLFSDRVNIAFSNHLVPLLGLLFLPWTALIYTVAYDPLRGVSALGWVFVVIAFVIDIASYGSGERERRARSASLATV
jgi:hypothetical protein